MSFTCGVIMNAMPDSSNKIIILYLHTLFCKQLCVVFFFCSCGFCFIYKFLFLHSSLRQFFQFISTDSPVRPFGLLVKSYRMQWNFLSHLSRWWTRIEMLKQKERYPTVQRLYFCVRCFDVGCYMKWTNNKKKCYSLYSDVVFSLRRWLLFIICDAWKLYKQWTNKRRIRIRETEEK